MKKKLNKQHENENDKEQREVGEAA